MQFLLKHKKVILLTTCFLIAFTILCHTNTDFDFWFHYDAGRYLALNHKIPDQAISSWFGMQNHLGWISHEWLFGYLCYLVTTNSTLYVAPMLAALIMASLITFILYLNIDRLQKAPLKVSIIVLLLSFLLSASTVMRPQLIFYWFTIILYLILQHEYDHPDNRLFWLVPLTVAWVNLHGGSYALIFVFYIIMICLNLFEFDSSRIKLHRNRKQVFLKRMLILLLCLVAVRFNAHGVEMYSYPFTNMGDNVMLSTIAEWQPLTLPSMLMVFLVLPIWYFYVIFNNKKEINAFEVLYALGFLFMGFKSVRFLPQLNLVILLLLPKHIQWSESGTKTVYKFIMPVLIFYFFFSSINSISAVYENPFDMTVLPSNQIIESIKEDKPERLYNNYNAGGYLTYKEIPTFIDGRADIYSKYNTMDYYNISNCIYGFEPLLDKYDFDAFLVSKSDMFYKYLLDNEYKLISQDNSFAYFSSEK